MNKKIITTILASIVGTVFIVSAFLFTKYPEKMNSALSHLSFMQATALSLKAIDKTSTYGGDIRPAEISRINSLIKNNPDTATVATIKEQLQKRKGLMLSLAKDNPQLFLVLSIPASIRNMLPPELQSYIEKQETLTGKLDVIHVDDFEHEENSHFLYSLRQGKDSRPLYLTTPFYAESDTPVTVQTTSLDNVSVADTKDLKISGKAPKLESVGNQKTLVFLVNFQDSGPAPFTKADAKRMVFNGQFEKFYEEQSNQLVSFSGDVVDWVTIPRESTSYCGNVSITDAEIQSALAANGLDLGNYKRIIYLLNVPLGGGCSTVGASDNWIGDKIYHISQSWVGLGSYMQEGSALFPFSWNDPTAPLSHEIGHALGVLHANGWECSDNMPLRGEDCHHLEYGNAYDIMGGGSLSLHFNAFYKELLGWIKPKNIETITASGTYSLQPLEVIGIQKGGPINGKRIAKIQMPGSSRTPFYLEFRKGLGFDSGLNSDRSGSLGGGFASGLNNDGLFVNYIRNLDGPVRYTRLLDMTPTSEYWPEDIHHTTLTTNDPAFVDQGTGITIGPIMAMDDNNIKFSVTLTNPVCVHLGLSGPYTSSAGGAYVGMEGSIFANITNNDTPTCPPSTFRIMNIKLPKGWNYNFTYFEKAILNPEQDGYVGFNVTSPQNTIPSTYPISYDVKNITSGLKSTFQTSFQVIECPVGGCGN